IKAAREGKLETNWLDPNEPYERALRGFVRAILDRSKAQPFLVSFQNFSRRTALLGALNSLTQLVLKATMPGVPDFYQGTEGWDLSLVDPDNRRPVDFAARQALLAAGAAPPDWHELAQHWADGRIKFALTHRLLRLRRSFPVLFQDGDYQPVEVAGPHRRHVLAFSRSAGTDRVIVAVGRHFGRITDGGNHWPVTDWQAELGLLGRDHAGLSDALGEVSAQAPKLDIGHLFATRPFAILRTP
ncbi:MAG: malto-oligosyltrehalose synthase, partial [Bradyrhizobium sp.]